MTNVYRECFTCGKSFIHSEMESLYYPDWHKIIYYCKECTIRQEHDTEIIPKPTNFVDHHSEPITFAEKYKSLKGKIEWGDK